MIGSAAQMIAWRLRSRSRGVGRPLARPKSAAVQWQHGQPALREPMLPRRRVSSQTRHGTCLRLPFPQSQRCLPVPCRHRLRSHHWQGLCTRSAEQPEHAWLPLPRSRSQQSGCDCAHHRQLCRQLTQGQYFAVAAALDLHVCCFATFPRHCRQRWSWMVRSRRSRQGRRRPQRHWRCPHWHGSDHWRFGRPRRRSWLRASRRYHQHYQDRRRQSRRSGGARCCLLTSGLHWPQTLRH